jgi:hypothetical protein
VSDPDDNPRQQGHDPGATAADAVTGSTEHATGVDQAAENRENESPA